MKAMVWFLGSVYRIPGTNESRFITKLKQIVHGIKIQNKDIIIGTNEILTI